MRVDYKGSNLTADLCKRYAPSRTSAVKTQRPAYDLETVISGHIEKMRTTLNPVF